MSKPPYASTHPHPTHIDIPPAPPTRAPEDFPESLDGAEPMDAAVLSDDEHHLEQDLAPGAEMGRRPSASRPPPPRGILKNPLRRPSMPGPTPSDAPISPATDAERVQWDEANIAATEIQKDSLMCVTPDCSAGIDAWACPKRMRASFRMEDMLTIPQEDRRAQDPFCAV